MAFLEGVLLGRSGCMGYWDMKSASYTKGSRCRCSRTVVSLDEVGYVVLEHQRLCLEVLAW